MRILGIESSADETSAAVVEDGRTLLSNATQSQINLHKIYGGIVPEISARSHIEAILPVIEAALEQAKTSWPQIDAIGVTYAPGQIGSLLIGALTAQTLALVKKKPLYPIHHVQAHVYANFLMKTPPEFPMLALIVSGGHSQLVLFQSHQEYEILGRTQDDAVGEAFDKVAKILGLPYPGGPSIAVAAKNGDPHKYKLPKAKLVGKYDFSFSGLKTATLRTIQKEVGKDFTFPSYQLAPLLSQQQINDFAASFEYIALETLVDKTLLAYRQYSPSSVVIAGGVAASQVLRRQLSERLPTVINYPPPSLCTDNAAMIAALAYYQSQFEQPIDPRVLEVVPSLSM
jgi:N6-L-threonylcarbamoyladenine synthase